MEKIMNDKYNLSKKTSINKMNNRTIHSQKSYFKSKIGLTIGLLLITNSILTAQKTDAEVAKEDHLHLRISNSKNLKLIKSPEGSQWWSESGLGLFIHWGLSSVKGEYDLSWAMIPGRDLTNRKVTDEEVEQILKTKDFDLDGYADTLKGHRPRLGSITPAEYYKDARNFKAEMFDADKIIGNAAKAGFKYAVLTVKHHEGFALWPSEYGSLSTKNYMNGRDLLKEYVDACRKYGLRVGFYFSGGDFHFANSHGRQNFLYYGVRRSNPDFPAIDENWDAYDRPEDDEAWNKTYNQFRVDQIKELLTRYGKISVLWFDGGVPDWAYGEIVKLQPEILINQRWHGPAHFDSGFENHFPDEKPETLWEMCRTWNRNGWGYSKDFPYRKNAFVISELVKVRAWGGNYLLNVAPNGEGELPIQAYHRMNEFTSWMEVNKESVYGVKSLPEGEKCDFFASSKGNVRYVYLTREFYEDKGNLLLKAPKNIKVTFYRVSKPQSVTILGSSFKPNWNFLDGTITIEVPATEQTLLVDVIKVGL